jgi:hypothetical protein
MLGDERRYRRRRRVRRAGEREGLGGDPMEKSRVIRTALSN